MRLIAASVVVALTAAVLGSCGVGIALAAKSTKILPVTGVDVVPFVAVASLFLVVGAVAFIAGRTGR